MYRLLIVNYWDSGRQIRGRRSQVATYARFSHIDSFFYPQKEVTKTLLGKFNMIPISTPPSIYVCTPYILAHSHSATLHVRCPTSRSSSWVVGWRNVLWLYRNYRLGFRPSIATCRDLQSACGKACSVLVRHSSVCPTAEYPDDGVLLDSRHTGPGRKSRVIGAKLGGMLCWAGWLADEFKGIEVKKELVIKNRSEVGSVSPICGGLKCDYEY